MSRNRTVKEFADVGSLTAFLVKYLETQGGAGSRIFSLVMEEDGVYKAYNYSGQPCYGELRKYSMTHGTMCTRPESEKPDDLYDPFPTGKPFAIAIPFMYGGWDPTTDSRDHFIEALVDEDSPWIRGFGSPDKVQLVKKNGHYSGFILWDMHVDPTVMIHLIWMTCYINKAACNSFDSLIEHDLTKLEALALLYANSNADPFSRLTALDDYHFGSRLSLKRFFDKNPRDFSGGLFDEGYDYNRHMIQDIFYSETGMCWDYDLFSNGGFKIPEWGVWKQTLPKAEFVTKVKQIFAKALKEEKAVIDEPFPTEAPVMNIVDGKEVFQIHPGWDDDDDDSDDDYGDDYGGDNCQCPDCVAERAAGLEEVKAPTPFWQDLNQAPKSAKK